MFTQEESCLQELWCSIRVTRPAEPIQKYTSLAHRKLSSAIEAIWLMSTHFKVLLKLYNFIHSSWQNRRLITLISGMEQDHQWLFQNSMKQPSTKIELGPIYDRLVHNFFIFWPQNEATWPLRASKIDLLTFHVTLVSIKTLTIDFSKSLLTQA